MREIFELIKTYEKVVYIEEYIYFVLFKIDELYVLHAAFTGQNRVFRTSS
jgi:hypothetical protein